MEKDIEDAEMEVIVHTFDTLDQTARLRLQPISIKSQKLLLLIVLEPSSYYTVFGY